MVNLKQKYRPTHLEGVYGCANTVGFLKSVINRPEESPRYFGLFGGYGLGKTTIARAFANSLKEKVQVTYDEIDSGDKTVRDNFDKIRD